MTKSLLFLSIAAVLLTSCGKPNNPEDYTGGYQIAEKFETPGFSNDIIKDGDYCYVTQGEAGLLVVDASNPKNLSQISLTTHNVKGYSDRIAKKDETIYIGAGTYGVTVVNVADVSHPFVTLYNMNIKPSRALYVMDDYLITAINAIGVKISWLKNPTHPDIRGQFHTDGYAKSTLATQDRSKLFVATGEMGLSIFDISNWEEGYGSYPLLSSIGLPGYAENIYLMEEQSLAFVTCGKKGLQVVDYSDLSNVHIVGSYDSGGYAFELAYQDNKIYMTAKGGGLHIIDVTSPTNPTVLGIIDSEYALGVSLDDTYIYVADKEEGILVIEKP